MAKDTTDRRKARVRRTLRARAYGKPRLSVFRSSKQIYAQIIDDANGVTLAAASSIEKAQREGAEDRRRRRGRQGHRQADRRTRGRRRRDRGRVRSRRVHVPRPRQGAGRRRPRRRAAVLIGAIPSQRLSALDDAGLARRCWCKTPSPERDFRVPGSTWLPGQAPVIGRRPSERRSNGTCPRK